MRNKISQKIALLGLFTFFIQAVTQNAEAQSNLNSDIDNRLKRLELEIKVFLFSEQHRIVFQKNYKTTKELLVLRKTSLSKNRFCGEYDS